MYKSLPLALLLAAHCLHGAANEEKQIAANSSERKENDIYTFKENHSFAALCEKKQIESKERYGRPKEINRFSMRKRLNHQSVFYGKNHAAYYAYAAFTANITIETTLNNQKLAHFVFNHLVNQLSTKVEKADKKEKSFSWEWLKHIEEATVASFAYLREKASQLQNDNPSHLSIDNTDFPLSQLKTLNIDFLCRCKKDEQVKVAQARLRKEVTDRRIIPGELEFKSLKYVSYD